MRAQLASAAAISAALLVCGLAAPPAAAQVYPRVGLYGSVVGGGAPYVKADFTLDTLEIARVARFDEVVLDVYPISPYRPDIVQAMKARNPKMHILAYVLAEHIWDTGDPDSLRHIPTIIRHTVRDLGGFLYDKNTGLEYANNSINLAKRDATGRFVVAEAMADIFRDHIINTGLWDGIFTDVFCLTISWTQSGTGQVIDLQRAGYPTAAALDAAWQAAGDTLANRLRRYAPPGYILVGNCGPSGHHDVYNGWLRENFPFQQGGTWYSNILGDFVSRGYLADDRDYVQPPHNWIMSASTMSPGTEYQSYNTAKVRYGLASATLGEGVHTFGPSKNVRDGNYQDWWYDEYAVDLGSGRSSEAMQHTGWLGRALTDAHKMLWVSTAPDAVTNHGFETDVTTDWLFVSFAPASATVARDATTAAVGAASAKVHVETPGTVDWHVYLENRGRTLVQAGRSYTATFWCKSSVPRIIHVKAGDSGGQAFVAVDTTWRQYQAVMVPTVSVNASLTFWIGDEASDLWFDDVHFQPGVSSVWRRDFQNGIVLLNPTELTLDVQLEQPFRRLLGVHAPAVNDGTVSATQRIPPFDALFLLRAEIDTTRPAPVPDLRIGP